MRRIITWAVALTLCVSVAHAQETPASLEAKIKDLKIDDVRAEAEKHFTAIEAGRKARAEAAALAEKADGDAKAGFEKTVAAEDTKLENEAELLQVCAQRLDALGGDVGKYQDVLMAILGVRIENLSLGLLEVWLGKAKDWLVDNGPGLLWKVLLFFLILFVFKILARAGGGMARRTLSMSKLNVSDLLASFFIGVVQKVVFFVGLLIAISTIGVDIGPLLAGVGVMGFVIGFALQGTLSNFASGIMILLYRPYDIGDFVDAAGVQGKVSKMSLVSTTLLTPDNQVVVVPNNKIWGGVITNVTARPTRRVDMTMGIGYADDIEKAALVINRVVNAHDMVLEDPAPAIEVAKVSVSSVEFAVRPWTRTPDYWTVKFDLTRQVKQEFDKEGIRSR
ncbi:MAG: mechanosensitive ion channel family protein [Planctomycetota bacterium]